MVKVTVLILAQEMETILRYLCVIPLVLLAAHLGIALGRGIVFCLALEQVNILLIILVKPLVLLAAIHLGIALAQGIV